MSHVRVGVLVTASPGCSIWYAAAEAVKLRDAEMLGRGEGSEQAEVVLIFNDLPVEVTKDSTAESICADYYKGHEKRYQLSQDARAYREGRR